MERFLCDSHRGAAVLAGYRSSGRGVNMATDFTRTVSGVSSAMYLVSPGAPSDRERMVLSWAAQDDCIYDYRNTVATADAPYWCPFNNPGLHSFIKDRLAVAGIYDSERFIMNPVEGAGEMVAFRYTGGTPTYIVFPIGSEPVNWLAMVRSSAEMGVILLGHPGVDELVGFRLGNIAHNDHGDMVDGTELHRRRQAIKRCRVWRALDFVEEACQRAGMIRYNPLATGSVRFRTEIADCHVKTRHDHSLLFLGDSFSKESVLFADITAGGRTSDFWAALDAVFRYRRSKDFQETLSERTAGDANGAYVATITDDKWRNSVKRRTGYGGYRVHPNEAWQTGRFGSQPGTAILYRAIYTQIQEPKRESVLQFIRNVLTAEQREVLGNASDSPASRSNLADAFLYAPAKILTWTLLHSLLEIVKFNVLHLLGYEAHRQLMFKLFVPVLISIFLRDSCLTDTFSHGALNLHLLREKAGGQTVANMLRRSPFPAEQMACGASETLTHQKTPRHYCHYDPASLSGELNSSASIPAAINMGSVTDHVVKNMGILELFVRRVIDLFNAKRTIAANNRAERRAAVGVVRKRQRRQRKREMGLTPKKSRGQQGGICNEEEEEDEERIEKAVIKTDDGEGDKDDDDVNNDDDDDDDDNDDDDDYDDDEDDSKNDDEEENEYNNNNIHHHHRFLQQHLENKIEKRVQRAKKRQKKTTEKETYITAMQDRIDPMYSGQIPRHRVSFVTVENEERRCTLRSIQEKLTARYNRECTLMHGKDLPDMTGVTDNAFVEATIKMIMNTLEDAFAIKKGTIFNSIHMNERSGIGAWLGPSSLPAKPDGKPPPRLPNPCDERGNEEVCAMAQDAILAESKPSSTSTDDGYNPSNPQHMEARFVELMMDPPSLVGVKDCAVAEQALQNELLLTVLPMNPVFAALYCADGLLQRVIILSNIVKYMNASVVCLADGDLPTLMETRKAVRKGLAKGVPTSLTEPLDYRKAGVCMIGNLRTHLLPPCIAGLKSISARVAGGRHSDRRQKCGHAFCRSLRLLFHFLKPETSHLSLIDAASDATLVRLADFCGQETANPNWKVQLLDPIILGSHQWTTPRRYSPLPTEGDNDGRGPKDFFHTIRTAFIREGVVAQDGHPGPDGIPIDQNQEMLRMRAEGARRETFTTELLVNEEVKWRTTIEERIAKIEEESSQKRISKGNINNPPRSTYGREPYIETVTNSYPLGMAENHNRDSSSAYNPPGENTESVTVINKRRIGNTNNDNNINRDDSDLSLHIGGGAKGCTIPDSLTPGIYRDDMNADGIDEEDPLEWMIRQGRAY